VHVTQEDAGGEPVRPVSFAEKLARLVDVVHRPGEPPMTDRALARRIQEQGGSVSAAYLAELRTGRKTNPSLDHARQIARAFGVRPAYFLDDEVAEQVDRELDRLEARHRSARLQELAVRTADLDDRDRRLLAELVQKELDKHGTDEP
jgi:transcriptional regulator with XRE-family HTH domain